MYVYVLVPILKIYRFVYKKKKKLHKLTLCTYRYYYRASNDKKKEEQDQNKGVKKVAP